VLILTPTLTLSLTLNPNGTNPKLQARIPGPHFTICRVSRVRVSRVRAKARARVRLIILAGQLQIW